MYYNNKFRQKSTDGHQNSFRDGYSKPAFGRSFQRPSNRGFAQRRSQLEGADINMFIKKATPVTIEEGNTTNASFEDFNLISPLKINIKNQGYNEPTMIQSQAIKPILEGRDVIGLAATGTGKTAAFLIPLINKLFTQRDQRALIIVPTRELAVQIREEVKSLTVNMHLYSAFIIGGANMKRQMMDLRRDPQIVIATPGRLKDLIERKAIYLQDYSNIVLDEVDLMVDIGFIRDIKLFISLMPKQRQSLFFSATIPYKVSEVLKSFVVDPVTISVKKQITSENVEQDVIKVERPEKKLDQLHDLLIKDGFDKVLIFGKTKHGIEKLNNELSFRGFKVGAIHGNKRQSQRQRVLESFKRDEIQILLATDVASRGLDIDNVTHVINYDLPQTYDDYVHRIGRTGRAGKVGTALTFV
jgi:ATP-dependent RNA helicase RhlE